VCIVYLLDYNKLVLFLQCTLIELYSNHNNKIQNSDWLISNNFKYLLKFTYCSIWSMINLVGVWLGQKTIIPCEGQIWHKLSHYVKKVLHDSSCEWYEVTWIHENIMCKFYLGIWFPNQTFTYGIKRITINHASFCRCVSKLDLSGI